MSEHDPDQAYEDILVELKDIIQDQVEHLKKLSKKGKLKPAENRRLLDLIRQVKVLKQKEMEEALRTPDDDLERIAVRQRVRKHRTKKNENLIENSGQGAETA